MIEETKQINSLEVVEEPKQMLLKNLQKKILKLYLLIWIKNI